MKVSKRDSTDERRVLIGLVVDKRLLSHVVREWDGNLFSSRWSNLIGKWCVTYYERFSEAPGKSIESSFDRWAEGQRDKETVELVERFLIQLSGSYEKNKKESQTDYLIDCAGRLFNRVRLDRLADTIKEELADGKVEVAVETHSKYRKVQIGRQRDFVSLDDSESALSAFDISSHPPLIVYPGALEFFFGRSLSRSCFVAVMAPEKTGKSFWLLDLAWRAMCQRRRVAFFDAGDMTEDQVLRRFWVRAARHPEHPCKYNYPVNLKRAEDGYSLKFKEKEVTERLDAGMALKAFRKAQRSHVKSNDSYLRIATHASNTLSVVGIQEILNDWEESGWTPDVVVIDYADILAPMPGTGQFESRDQINKSWMAMRQLSQLRHCLVLTATQADAKSYIRKTLTKSNFSEDKRKLAHVTGLLGLNALEDERSEGLMRLNWVVRRDAGFRESQACYVATCMGIANPAVLSVF